MTIPFQLPQLGSGPVIQSPGVGGTIAQGMSQLPQILMQRQQMEQQAENARLNQQYLLAQMSHMKALEAQQQAAAQEDARQQAAVGQAMQMYNTPTMNVGFQSKLPVMTPGEMPSEQDVMAQMNPQDVPIFLDKAKDQIAERKKGAINKQYAKTLQTLLSKGEVGQADLQAALRQVPPERQGDLLASFRELKTPEGTWHQDLDGNTREIVYRNPVTKEEWKTGASAPAPSPGVTINMPSEFERRTGALSMGTDEALSDIATLRSKGYNPLNESWFAKGVDKVPVVGKMLQRAALSTEGKLYYSAAKVVMTNWLYAASGANSTIQEAATQADILLQDMFENAATLEQKERFMLGKGEELRRMGGRAVTPGNAPLKRTWEQLIREDSGEDAKFGSEFDKINKKKGPQ